MMSTSVCAPYAVAGFEVCHMCGLGLQCRCSRVINRIEQLCVFPFRACATKMHRERRAYSRNELSWSQVVETGVGGQGRRVRGQSEQGLPKKELVREAETIKSGIGSASNGYFVALLKVGCLIFLYTKQASSGGPEVGLNGLQPPRGNRQNKLNKPANVHSRSCDLPIIE